MKCTTVIDRTREEEVLIYTHQKTPLTEQIEALVKGNASELIGYNESKQIAALPADEIVCITVENGKVFARSDTDKWQLRERLYIIEERLGANFVRINQSCIANIKKIDRFDASIGGSLLVFFKNGYRDYVSRRQLKNVKERIGFRL